MKLSDLQRIGKRVCFAGDDALVIDYSDQPPTVEFSDGRRIEAESWDCELPDVSEPSATVSDS